MMLESLAHFMRWKERSIGTIFFRNAFLPKIHWLHDMRIRRDNDTIDTLTVTIASRHIFILPILLVYSFWFSRSLTAAYAIAVLAVNYSLRLLCLSVIPVRFAPRIDLNDWNGLNG